MKHLLTIAAALIFSGFAFAGGQDFSNLDNAAIDHGGHHKCMKAAWDASSPTADQTAKLKVLTDNLQALFQANEAALKTAHSNLMASFAPHPIDKAAVHTAQDALHSILVPLMTAATDTAVDGINLLTADQRKTFDAAFAECEKKP